MSIFGKSLGHFTATIDVHPYGPKADQRSGPAYNGIRWSFVYAEDIETLGLENAPHSDVWPEFLEQSGHSLDKNTPLIGSYIAKMHIIFPKMVPTHFARLKIGTGFYCMEGRKQMAFGEVTDLKVD